MCDGVVARESDDDDDDEDDGVEGVLVDDGFTFDVWRDNWIVVISELNKSWPSSEYDDEDATDEDDEEVGIVCCSSWFCLKKGWFFNAGIKGWLVVVVRLDSFRWQTWWWWWWWWWWPFTLFTILSLLLVLPLLLLLLLLLLLVLVLLIVIGWVVVLLGCWCIC